MLVSQLKFLYWQGMSSCQPLSLIPFVMNNLIHVNLESDRTTHYLEGYAEALINSLQCVGNRNTIGSFILDFFLYISLLLRTNYTIEVYWVVFAYGWKITNLSYYNLYRIDFQ